MRKNIRENSLSIKSRTTKSNKTGSGLKNKNRKKKRSIPGIKILLMTAVCLLIIAAGSGLLNSLISRIFTEALQAENSVFEETIEANFLVVRHETTVHSPFTGRLETVCREGERVAKGNTIGYLVRLEGTSLEKNKKVPLVSPRAGILSFHIDGLENICSPQIWPQLDLRKITDLEKGLLEKIDGDDKTDNLIEAGDDFYKIIDNLLPSYLFLEIRDSIPESIQKNKTVDIRLDGTENQVVRGTVTDLYQEGEITRALIEVPSLSAIQDLRHISGKVIINKYNGVVVENNILVKRENETGIYLLKEKRVVWRKVDIVVSSEKRAVIEGIKPGEWIITTPGLVKEGQEIFFNN